MKKGLFFIFLIACVLIIGGYLFIRFSLQSSVNKDAKSLSTEKTGSDTSKVSNSSLDLRPLFIARMQQLIKNKPFFIKLKGIQIISQYKAANHKFLT